LITRRYDGSRLPELGTVQRHHLTAYICDPNKAMARISKSRRRSFDPFRPTAFSVLSALSVVTKCSYRSRLFPETDQRSAIPADAGYKPDANSLDARTAKRRRAQTSDEAAEAEQLRSQQTALPLARTAVTFESKLTSVELLRLRCLD